MNNKQNIPKIGRLSDQQKDKSRCNFKYISEIINNLSMLCSFVGISLFGAIFFGLTEIVDYRNMILLNECAHYMVIAAVILFFLAPLPSFFQDDSKENSPVVVQQRTVTGRVLPESNHSENFNTEDKKLMGDKLKFTERNNNAKQSTMTEIFNPTNTSSTALKYAPTSKHEEIGSIMASSNISSKNIQNLGTTNPIKTKLNTSSASISPEIPQNANTSKQGEISRTLFSNISSKTLQQASIFNRRENTITLSSNISTKSLQPAVSSTKRESARTLSSDISSETQLANMSNQSNSARTLSTKFQSLNLNKETSNVGEELVPCQQQFENLSHAQYVPAVSPPRVPNFTSFMSTGASGNRPTEEITASQKMTYFTGGAEEEYRITRTTFYQNRMWGQGGVNDKAPWYPSHEISSGNDSRPDHENRCFSRNKLSYESESKQNIEYDSPFRLTGGISSKSESKQNVEYDNPLRLTGGISSRRVRRPNLYCPCYSGGRQDSQSVSGRNLCHRCDQASSFLLHPWLGEYQIAEIRARIESQGWLPPHSALRQNLENSWYSEGRIFSQSASTLNRENHYYRHT